MICCSTSKGDKRMKKYEELSTVLSDEEFEREYGDEAGSGEKPLIPDAKEADSFNRASGSSPGIESASDLLRRSFPEPKWAIEGLLAEGATVFAGAPKVGKSWCALGFALAVASGGLHSTPLPSCRATYST